MIKENNLRKEVFQLRTTVDSEKKIIYKEANSKSLVFLNSFIEKEKKLKKIKNISFNKIINKKNNKIFFEYIEWKTFEDILNSFNTEKEIIDYINNNYINLINKFKTIKLDKNNYKKAISIFWNKILKIKNDDFIENGLLDLIFSNIIIDNNWKKHIIDYEWCFDFPINKKYIIWRAIYIFIVNLWLKNSKLNLDSIYKKLKKELDINYINEYYYLIIEYNFQKYVNKSIPNIFTYIRVFYIMTKIRFKTKK